jgi:hypothetical protein
VLQGECLTPFYPSPTQNILPFTLLVLKLVVCVLHSAGVVPRLARSGLIDTLEDGIGQPHVDLARGCPNRAESRGGALRLVIRPKRAPRRFDDSAIL